MEYKGFQNSKGNVTGLCVVVDCVAGTDAQVLEGLVENFSKDRPDTILPVSIGYIRSKGDYIIPMLVQDISDADDVIIDKVRTVEGVCDIKSYIFNLTVPELAEGANAGAEPDDDEPLLCHGMLFVDVESGKDRHVLKTISRSSDPNVQINFLGHCFHSFDCDLVAFISAPDQNILHQWVRENIRPIDGVLDTSVDVITGMEPLIGPDEMMKLMEILNALEEG